MKADRSIPILHSIHEKYPNGYAVRIVGRSMEPTLRDDDGVLVDPDGTPKHNDIVAVNLHSSGGIVGRLKITPHGMWLAKDNPEAGAVLLPPGQFEIDGIVRCIVSRYEGPEDLASL